MSAKPLTDYEFAKDLGITQKGRWEDGLPHDPRSERLFRFLQQHDWEDCCGAFDWKCGGDGDNGETLMYQLDAWYETMDQLEEEQS